MPTVSAKVEDSGRDAIKEIAYLNRMDRAQVILRAITFYLEENPDGIKVPEVELGNWKDGIHVKPMD